jgi:hypothetical protein
LRRQLPGSRPPDAGPRVVSVRARRNRTNGEHPGSRICMQARTHVQGYAQGISGSSDGETAASVPVA